MGVPGLAKGEWDNIHMAYTAWTLETLIDEQFIHKPPVHPSIHQGARQMLGSIVENYLVM